MRIFIPLLTFLLLTVSSAWAADLGLTSKQFRRNFAVYIKKLEEPPLPEKPQWRKTVDGKVNEAYQPSDLITFYLVSDSASGRISNITVTAKGDSYEDGQRAQSYFLSLMAVFVDVEDGRTGLVVLGIKEGSVFDGKPRIWKIESKEFILSYDRRDGLKMQINAL